MVWQFLPQQIQNQPTITPKFVQFMQQGINEKGSHPGMIFDIRLQKREGSFYIRIGFSKAASTNFPQSYEMAFDEVFGVRH